MLEIFNKTNDNKSIGFKHPKYRKIVTDIMHEINVVKDYYRTANRYVARPNLLIDIVNLLDINHNLSIEEVLLNIDTDFLYISNMVGITSNVVSNSVYKKGVILNNVNESFLFIEEDMISSNKDYNSYKPIRVKATTLDSIFITHPVSFTGAIEDYDSAFYTIDVRTLAIQYYYWKVDNIKLGLDIDPARFIYEVVLTNLVEDFLDINIMNRFMKIANNEPVSKFVNYNMFNTKDLQDELDGYLKAKYKFINKLKGLTYRDYLTSFATVLEDSISLLNIPVTYFNSKNSFFNFIIRVDYIIFLLKHCEYKFNRDYITKLKIFIKEKRGNGSFKLRENKELTTFINVKINEIEDLIEEVS